MASEVKSPGMKQLKVDNWATFFMQRLQLLFAKGDSCDITLKFFTGQELKVHSLVLRTCTSHFDTLPKDDDVISLPEVLSYSAVFPIINFMYSGKLEFKPELHSKLLAIAKILNITILLKLLVAQRDGPSGVSVKAKAVTSTPEKPSPQQLIVQQTTPSSSYSLFSGKKLPFWRKRTLPIVKYSDRKPAEDEPGPTRFNWPENEPTDWILISSPSFCALSYETEPILKAPVKIEHIDRTLLPPRRIIESRLLTTHDSDDDDDDRFETNYSSDEESPATPVPPPPPPPPPPPVLKPCLKSPSTESQTPPPTKRVRFSLGAEGKENSVNSAQTSASNHAKIIAEVLKKYPDLVKNKNIKLKISSPKPKVENGASNEEKASYVVLRPTVRAGSTTVTQTTPKNEPSLGPWSCDHCPEIKFENYHEFRKHIQEAHGEKLDARICEYCGYKASKRNLHLYHLFTKHNVPPPKNISFPKCTECCYIALSDSLLVKHMNNHMQARESKETAKENQCDVCKVVLRNQASLCAHKVTCKPGNEPRHIICDLCKTAFRTNVSLNAHLKECQGKPEPTTTIFSEDGDQPVEMIEVPIIEAVNMEKGDHTLVQLPSGIILADNQNMALLPTSDADGLNGVTTSIATSIALALPQDQQAVILLHGNGQEYIVPEFLEGNFTTGNIAYTTGQNQVIYLGSSPGNGTNQEVIHLEEIKISPSSPSTSAIQEKTDNKEIVQQTLSVVETSDQESKSQISQNLIINVQGEIAQTANAQLDQSGIILVNTNKQIGRTIVGGAGKSNNNGQKIILELKEEDLNEAEEKIESLETSQILEEDGTLVPYKPSEESEVANEGETINRVECKESEPQSPNEVKRVVETDTLLDANALQETIELDETTASQENTLLQENDKQTENSAITNKVTSELQRENIQEVSLDNSKPCEVINFAGEPTENLKLREKNITDEELSSKLVVEAQGHLETEQMQVDEGREDMIVDDNKDEEMDVEENSEQKESKDAMDIEESDKTGDERVDSLVKDWGFDDDDTEEIIDDPDRKPLRPDIDIQL